MWSCVGKPLSWNWWHELNNNIIEWFFVPVNWTLQSLQLDNHASITEFTKHDAPNSIQQPFFVNLLLVFEPVTILGSLYSRSTRAQKQFRILLTHLMLIKYICFWFQLSVGGWLASLLVTPCL